MGFRRSTHRLIIHARLARAGGSLSRIAQATIVLILPVAVVAGCGGTSTSTTIAATRASAPTTPATPAGPTKAQFIVRADAICARTNAKLKPVQGRLAALARGSELTIESAGATALRQGGAITREGIAQLQALLVPQGDASTVQKIITALDDEAADIDNMAAATAGGEASAIEAAKRAAQTTKATYQGLAQGYGLKVCGAGS